MPQLSWSGRPWYFVVSIVMLGGVMTQSPQTDMELDLTDQVCPMTFVRTRLALDGMEIGQTLAILLSGEEPRARVPQTVRALGHAVLAEQEIQGGAMRLLVRKSG